MSKTNCMAMHTKICVDVTRTTYKHLPTSVSFITHPFALEGCDFPLDVIFDRNILDRLKGRGVRVIQEREQVVLKHMTMLFDEFLFGLARSSETAYTLDDVCPCLLSHRSM